ncbi:MAG: hypothetical protein OEV06_04265 [Anaerolineae bacterium]|nr:hypothetical protein [Anaerolineae bacterium]
MLEKTDLVLVALMPHPRDLEIARVLGWYRIPLSTAPKIIAVDYLAFYQPASFMDRKWLIESVAPVRGYELATRAELLKDEQSHPRAAEEYFKIQLGPIEPLPSPVPAAEKWKRITFLYTTGERMLRAETIRDLAVHDEERRVLWSALRERAMADQGYQVGSLPEDFNAPEIMALFNLLGNEESNH